MFFGGSINQFLALGSGVPQMSRKMRKELCFDNFKIFFVLFASFRQSACVMTFNAVSKKPTVRNEDKCDTQRGRRVISIFRKIWIRVWVFQKWFPQIRNLAAKDSCNSSPMTLNAGSSKYCIMDSAGNHRSALSSKLLLRDIISRHTTNYNETRI